MGSDECHFNVSLIVRDKVTRQCPQTITFEEKGEPKWIKTEVRLLTSSSCPASSSKCQQNWNQNKLLPMPSSPPPLHPWGICPTPIHDEKMAQSAVEYINICCTDIFWFFILYFLLMFKKKNNCITDYITTDVLWFRYCLFFWLRLIWIFYWFF